MTVFLLNKQLFAGRMLAADLPVPDTYLPGQISAGDCLARHDRIILKPSFSSKAMAASSGRLLAAPAIAGVPDQQRHDAIARPRPRGGAGATSAKLRG